MLKLKVHKSNLASLMYGTTFGNLTSAGCVQPAYNQESHIIIARTEDN